MLVVDLTIALVKIAWLKITFLGHHWFSVSFSGFGRLSDPKEKDRIQGIA